MIRKVFLPKTQELTPGHEFLTGLGSLIAAGSLSLFKKGSLVNSSDPPSDPHAPTE